MEFKEMPALNDKHVQKIIAILRGEGWSDEKILDFIRQITE